MLSKLPKITSYVQDAATPAVSFKPKNVISEVVSALVNIVERIINRPIRDSSPKPSQIKIDMIKQKSSSQPKNEPSTNPKAK